jgi:hypothetical protein
VVWLEWTHYERVLLRPMHSWPSSSSLDTGAQQHSLIVRPLEPNHKLVLLLPTIGSRSEGVLPALIGVSIVDLWAESLLAHSDGSSRMTFSTGFGVPQVQLCAVSMGEKRCF